MKTYTNADGVRVLEVSVNVTEEDHLLGIPNDAYRCPVTRAIARDLGLDPNNLPDPEYILFEGTEAFIGGRWGAWRRDGCPTDGTHGWDNHICRKPDEQGEPPPVELTDYVAELDSHWDSYQDKEEFTPIPGSPHTLVFHEDTTFADQPEWVPGVDEDDEDEARTA